jgi:hypothetical protein
MIASIVAGGINGFVGPLANLWGQNKTQEKQLKAQQQMQQEALKYQQQNQKEQLKLAGYIALGLGILLLIYFVLKDD